MLFDNTTNVRADAYAFFRESLRLSHTEGEYLDEASAGELLVTTFAYLRAHCTNDVFARVIASALMFMASDVGEMAKSLPPQEWEPEAEEVCDQDRY